MSGGYLLEARHQLKTRRWLGAAALLVIAALFLSCRGGGDANPAGTATATTSPSRSPARTGCPDEKSCAVADTLLGLLNNHAYGTIFDHWPTAEVVCPGGPAVGDGAPYPLCDGAAAGEKRRGYWMANSVTYGALSSEQMIERLQPDTSSSANAWTLRTIGCPPGPGAVASCTSRVLVVPVALYASGRQQYYIFDLTLATGTWVVGGLTAGPLFQPALDAAVLDGGTVSTDSHLSIPAGTTFSPVTTGGGGSAVPATPAAGIGVSENSKPVATYPTMDEAITKASDVAGFQVLPVLNLPPGFSVSFFDALTAQPDPNAPYKPPQNAFYPRHVQIGVRSDSGGLLVDESSVCTTDEGDAVKIATSSLGDFYEFGPSDAPLKFELVTADRTFTILAPRANLTRSQALAILGGFH